MVAFWQDHSRTPSDVVSDRTPAYLDTHTHTYTHIRTYTQGLRRGAGRHIRAPKRAQAKHTVQTPLEVCDVPLATQPRSTGQLITHVAKPPAVWEAPLGTHPRSTQQITKKGAKRAPVWGAPLGTHPRATRQVTTKCCKTAAGVGGTCRLTFW